MTPVDFKEACRLFYMTKGHLGTNDETIIACADGYFKRLWGNHEACYRLDGFEEAYNKRINDATNK